MTVAHRSANPLYGACCGPSWSVITDQTATVRKLDEMRALAPMLKYPDGPIFLDCLFATADGRQITLGIAGEDPMWAALCRLLKLDQFVQLREQERSDRAAEIAPHLREAIAGWPYKPLCRQLEALRIAFGPVHRLQHVLADPQMLARSMSVTLDGPDGAQTFVRQPLMLDGGFGAITRPVPALGQHNAELLGKPAG